MKRVMCVVVGAFLLAGQGAHVRGVGRSRPVTFEGTLLEYSPHSGVECGVLYIHQVAKYRVEKVLAGKYAADEIVADHPACGGDIFQDLPVGSRVKLTVRLSRKYFATLYRGIREEERPKIFYVAEANPAKLKDD